MAKKYKVNDVDFIFVEDTGAGSNILPVFDTAGRPAAGSVLAGYLIFNTDVNAPQISNGTDWYDMLGNQT